MSRPERQIKVLVGATQTQTICTTSDVLYTAALCRLFHKHFENINKNMVSREDDDEHRVSELFFWVESAGLSHFLSL